MKTQTPYTKGNRIYFVGEKKPYTIQAMNDRFLVCTKAFFKTVLYTIVDLKEEIRGTENLIFCMGFEDAGQCEDALKRLMSGDSEISHRNRTRLLIA